MSKYPVMQKKLAVPTLHEVAEVLDEQMSSNFDEVDVDVVECPDLTVSPFNLIQKGLSGRPILLDIGASAYLYSMKKAKKMYDLKTLIEQLSIDPAFIIGAGVGPYPYVGRNCEGIFNLYIHKGNVLQNSRVAYVDPVDNFSPVQQLLPKTETRLGMFGNLFISKGQVDAVLQIKVKKRIGNLDFPTSIRQCLKRHFKQECVGLGGVFLTEKGSVKHQLMSGFTKDSLKSSEQINKWLKMYEFVAPLISVGTLISFDPNLGARLHHFHTFSDHDQAGHYHIDVTPDIVEYLAYFNVAEQLYRIDQP